MIKRSDGRSAVAAASYRSGETLRDDRAGATHRGRKSDVVHTAILAPASAPAWATDRERLWNEVEACERRRDAQLAREIQLALPHELTLEQNRELIESWAQRELVGRGMVADIAIHDPARARRRHGADGSDPRNVHAHVMATMREIGPEGFGKKRREWNDRALLEHWRSSWAEHVNEALERHGIDARVDHRSHADRGLELLPQPKLGPKASAMERRGIASRRGDFLREVHARNQERIALDRLELRQALDQSAADAAYERHLRQVEQQQETAPKIAIPRPVAKPAAQPPQAPEAHSPAPAPPAPISAGQAQRQIDDARRELERLRQRRAEAVRRLREGPTTLQARLAAHPRVQQARGAVERARARLAAAEPTRWQRLWHRLGGPDPELAKRAAAQRLEAAQRQLSTLERKLGPAVQRELAELRREASPVTTLRQEQELHRRIERLERERAQAERADTLKQRDSAKQALRSSQRQGARQQRGPRMTMRMGLGRR